MTGESAGEAGASAADAASGSKAVEPAAAATPAPGGSGGGVPATPAAPVPPPYTGPPPAKPRKQRVPVWAGAVLAMLPLWAVLYGGSFGERSTGEAAPLGQTVYQAQGCGGCHGPTGGGGVGPAMDGVAATFPEFADHVAWIRSGSSAVRGQPYGATGKIASGGMPGFPDLTEEEVVAVACYERVELGGSEPPPECEAGAGGTAPDAGGGGGEGDADSASAGH